MINNVLPLERITMSLYQTLSLMIVFATLVVLILGFDLIEKNNRLTLGSYGYFSYIII